MSWYPSEPRRRGAQGAYGNNPGLLHARQVAIEARAHPGKWVDLRAGVSAVSAGTKVWSLRHRPSAVFRTGTWEFRTEKRADGSYAVQIRYIGNSHPDAQPN